MPILIPCYVLLQRMIRAVAMLGEQEVSDIVAEQGKIEVTCGCHEFCLDACSRPNAHPAHAQAPLLPLDSGDFCNVTYQFSEDEVLRVIKEMKGEE